MIVIYTGIAVVFFVRTFLEGERKGLPWGAYRVFGLMLSAAWPALLLYVLVAALRARRGGA